MGIFPLICRMSLQFSQCEDCGARPTKSPPIQMASKAPRCFRDSAASRQPLWQFVPPLDVKQQRSNDIWNLKDADANLTPSFMGRPVGPTHHGGDDPAPRKRGAAAASLRRCSHCSKRRWRCCRSWQPAVPSLTLHTTYVPYILPIERHKNSQNSKWNYLLGSKLKQKSQLEGLMYVIEYAHIHYTHIHT
jgi:hypothetical protein